MPSWSISYANHAVEAMFTAASFIDQTNRAHALNNTDVLEDEEGKLTLSSSCKQLIERVGNNVWPKNTQCHPRVRRRFGHQY